MLRGEKSQYCSIGISNQNFSKRIRVQQTGIFPTDFAPRSNRPATFVQSGMAPRGRHATPRRPDAAVRLTLARNGQRRRPASALRKNRAARRSCRNVPRFPSVNTHSPIRSDVPHINPIEELSEDNCPKMTVPVISENSRRSATIMHPKVLPENYHTSYASWRSKTIMNVGAVSHEVRIACS